MGIFSKKNKAQNLRDRGYLKAIYEPLESWEKLEKEYNKRRSTHKNEKLRAETEGYLLGLRDRRNSRLEQLKQLKERQKGKDLSKER